jgi:hypothetical protein
MIDEFLITASWKIEQLEVMRSSLDHKKGGQTMNRNTYTCPRVLL